MDLRNPKQQKTNEKTDRGKETQEVNPSSSRSPLSYKSIHEGSPFIQKTLEQLLNQLQKDRGGIFGTREYQPDNPHQQEGTGHGYHDIMESRLDNPTGLPDQLKAGIEHLSGLSMDDVRVYYNSPKPARINALAYTEETKIYLGPGQEHCLAHEAWHVVQQMRGQVRKTMELEGMNINNESDLENEATQMGAKALNYPIDRMPMRPRNEQVSHRKPAQFEVSPGNVVQMYEVKGRFADPNSSSARALRIVMDSLPRSVAAILACYDSTPNTTLVLESTRRLGLPGYTKIDAYVGGAWTILEEICKPENTRGLQLCQDTPIRISIVVDPTEHGVPPRNHQLTATLTHEITVHAIHALPWLQKLRSGVYTNRQIRAAWRTSNQSGGLLEPSDEHKIFARGDNRSYNQTAQNVYENLPPNEKPLYQADIRSDIDNAAPNNSIPRYPI